MYTSSKKYFPEEFKKKIWEQLFKNFKTAKTDKDILNILEEILTVNELNIVEKRLVVKYLLNQRISIRETGRIADVNRSTVRFIKNGLKKRETKRAKSIPKEETYTDVFFDMFGLKNNPNSSFPRYRYIKKGKK